MIKAVFFDWFNTLAHYNPPREKLQGQVLQELGIHVSPQKITHGISVADRDYFEENATYPVWKRSSEEQAKINTRHQQIILNEAEVVIPGESTLLTKITDRVQQLSRGMGFTLFYDVLSSLKMLKEQNLTLGLLTNLDRDIQSICRDLGLDPYINFVVTSGMVGAVKPHPPIFLAALQKAGINASEAIHVGDQYQSDVIGALEVGITPILIDRNNLYPEVNDCLRIHSLIELMGHL